MGTVCLYTASEPQHSAFNSGPDLTSILYSVETVAGCLKSEKLVGVENLKHNFIIDRRWQDLKIKEEVLSGRLPCRMLSVSGRHSHSLMSIERLKSQRKNWERF